MYCNCWLLSCFKRDVAVKCVSIFPLFRHIVVDKSSKSHIKQPPLSQTPHLQWPHFCSDSFQEVCVCVCVCARARVHVCVCAILFCPC